MQALITCVDYSDFLSVTLPTVAPHFERVTVLTTWEDSETQELVERAPFAETYCCRMGAFKKGDDAYDGTFNKGAALDIQLTYMKGWICVLDADIVLPEKMDLSGIEPGYLYSPHRRMLEKPGPIPPESEWGSLPAGPEHENGELAGYFHLFHTDDPRFGSPPWYESKKWRTAQGCDTVFSWPWHPNRVRRLPFEVLHLGETRVNWNGRVSQKWTG